MTYFAYGLMAYLVPIIFVNLHFHDRRANLEIHKVNTRTGLVALTLFVVLTITLLLIG